MEGQREGGTEMVIGEGRRKCIRCVVISPSAGNECSDFDLTTAD